MRKRKLRVKRILIVFLISIVSIIGVYYFISNFTSRKTDEKKVEIINEIKEYEYSLDENHTKLFKTMFESLKGVLNASEVDEEEYATLISKMFVVDFYDLNSKYTNSDIGGVQFIHKDVKDNFVLNAQNTMYKYIENNLDGKRKQKLPVVTAVNSNGLFRKTYEYLDKKDEGAYEIKLNIEYKEDLDYPTEVTLILVKENEKKLAIVELY